MQGTTHLRWALAAWLCLWPGTAPANPPPGADLDSIHEWLLRENPQLRALALDLDAATATAQAAGALPDPMAGVELRQIDPAQPRVWPGQLDSTLYSVRQRFPLWGKRQLARDLANSEALSMRWMRDASTLKLLSQADLAWVNYWYGQAAVAAIDQMLARLEQIRALTESRYAAGLAEQQDAIAAQVEITRMRRDRIERQALALEAGVEMNALLGRAPDAVLAQPVNEPALDVNAGADGWSAARALDHPELRLQSALADAASTEAELSRRERYPDLTVGLGLMQSGDRLDSLELMFEMEIPLQQGARRQRERAAALRAQAAQTRQHAALIEHQGMHAQALARWRSAREQRQLIESSLTTQAQASVQSALTGYGVGKVDFGTLLEALRQRQGAELDRLDALRAELAAAVEVRALEGVLP